MLHPFPTLKPQAENNSADSPVGEHSDPDGHWAHTTDTDQINAQAETKHPHGGAGSDHGEFHIPSGAHAIGWNKGEHPRQASQW